MDRFLTKAGSFTGRVMIAAIFLMSAVGNKIPQFKGVAAAMANEGVPFPEVMLMGAILFLLVGSITVATGIYARMGGALLLAFLVLATYYFHDFWNFEGAEQQAQMIQFLKNLSLMGTMIFLWANGPGVGSVPWPSRKEGAH